MTEDEAKAKWCCGPPAIVGAAMAHLPGTEINPEKLARCVGSACMAWRWRPAEQTALWDQHVAAQLKGNPGSRGGAEDVVRRNGCSGFISFDKVDFAHAEGFCGLAGQP